MFAVIDRDGSGSIDLQELQEHVNSARAFAQAFGAPVVMEEGCVSEANELPEAAAADAALTDAELDRIAEAQIAKQKSEQATQGNMEPAVAAVFNSIDLDGDGIVTKSEFRQFFQGDCTELTLMNDVGVSWDEVKRAAADTTNTDAVLL